MRALSRVRPSFSGLRVFDRTATPAYYRDLRARHPCDKGEVVSATNPTALGAVADTGTADPTREQDIPMGPCTNTYLV